LASPVGATEVTTDVCVYGATPGGIAAATAAAKSGLKVVLVEPTDRIGGMMTCGLSYSDFRSFESLSGFFLEHAQRVQQHYIDLYGQESEQAKACWRGTIAEPRVNLAVFEQTLTQHQVTVMTQCALRVVVASPWRAGRRRLLNVSFRQEDRDEVRITAKVFIDGSYEGDLMAMAGENYHVGRESREQYGESMAGDSTGQGDGQVQGYNFRFVMTQVDSNRLLPKAPTGYQREDFVGVLEHFASGRLQRVFSDKREGIYRAHLPWLPNRKADINDTPHAPVRLSMPDMNDAYPEANEATRRAIVQQHQYYNVGLLYFLQNDPEVPAEIQAEAKSWGWCKDEFEQTAGLPPQLYIREARRMVGQHVFTEHDSRQSSGDARSVLHVDSIAMGDYVHNCHGTARRGTRYQGEHEGEFYKPVAPYQIAYGVIVPQKSENLLVPVACSASHFGFGALRLEPIWSSLGQAAGWAASLAIGDDVPVQHVNVPRLQTRLLSDRSALIYTSDVEPSSADFEAVQWFGLQGGLHALASDGQAKPRSLGGQYSEAHLGHSANLDQLLDAATLMHWQRLVPGVDVEAGQTRRHWIGAAYKQSLHDDEPVVPDLR